MTPAELVARILAVGGRMLDGPRLWLPRSVQGEERAEIIAGLVEHKEEVVALLPPGPPVFRQPVLTLAEKCSRCRKDVFEYDGNADGIYESCRLTTEGHLFCPYLRADSPLLVHWQRRWRQWETKKLSEAAKKEAEPLWE